MNTNEFLKAYRNEHRYPFDNRDILLVDKRPYCTMNDGFGISIQASDGHYCEPRTNEDVNYESVELGYPSLADDLILDYAEDPDIPTDTVYGWVPVEVVDKLIEKHGGINKEAVDQRWADNMNYQ